MPGESREAAAELARDWLRHARDDLAVARLAGDERVAPGIAAFSAKHAAEKALRALLVARQGAARWRGPSTHGSTMTSSPGSNQSIGWLSAVNCRPRTATLPNPPPVRIRSPGRCGSRWG
ncbi:MAG: HEPN domain-containing protein [Anaerolineae bacterium]|nr:HEPN domain-containing protein [Anaerolineae bacterium]